MNPSSFIRNALTVRSILRTHFSPLINISFQNFPRRFSNDLSLKKTFKFSPKMKTDSNVSPDEAIKNFFVRKTPVGPILYRPEYEYVSNKEISDKHHHIFSNKNKKKNLFPIPKKYKEVAFIGKSNVGKSSLLNALINKKNYFLTSSTPGRTQDISVCLLNQQILLTDMPGYGYAKAPLEEIAKWHKMSTNYLQSRPIDRIYLLVDSRRGILKSDFLTMDFLDQLGKSYQIIFTKIDKLSPSELKKLIIESNEKILLRPASHPQIFSTSVKLDVGIQQLRFSILETLGYFQSK